jgi:hypothetical protein
LVVLVLIVAGAVALIAQPFDDNSSAKALPPTPLERKAERVERQLAKDAEDPKLLLASMRAWLGAGYDRISKARNAYQPIPGFAVAADFKAGLNAWKAYLRQTGGEASVANAEIAGGAYVSLLELGSRDVAEIEANAAEAAHALHIASRHRQDLYTLSNVAVYEYLNGEYAAGSRAEREAAATFDAPARAAIVTEQLDAYRERAETFRRLLKQAAAEAEDGQLEEPLKAYVSGGGLNQEDPTPKPGDN